MSDSKTTDSQPVTPLYQVTSPWAVASLLCSIAVCCPVMSLIGVLLGLRALVQINADARIRGRAMATTGVVIGVLAAVLWLGFAVWWHFNARLPMKHGPLAELQAGMTGDIAAFKAGFRDGSTLPDQHAQQFLNQLESRYGRVLDSSISQTSTTKAAMAGSTELTIPYTFTFGRQTVEVEAVFITFAPTRLLPQPVFKWVSIRIIDPDRGDLVYPVP